MEPDAVVYKHNLVRKPSLYQRISNAFFGRRTDSIERPPPNPSLVAVQRTDQHATIQHTRELLLRTSIGSNAWLSALIGFATYGKQNDIPVTEFEIMREAFAPVEELPMLKKMRSGEIE
mmetsp:Transcript_19103/g.34755  ORF Transcript_19103/g.34755 Transcript_19103/m.34755 type:complete len:119 (-) Transcript_19103:135-491(-)